ncbi:lysine exporter protein [Amycolatopsis mediterranei S699]|uniref:Lysine exporter protein n=2 Tax=Amycolatopsis mediterranei TaxID=33910 RepID=A0A0H3CW35_AMYMU|nr:LysE family translocator [Amycolatopsis mediterranei]ADJ42518.1 lysine exporter protein [Amycolatopsis mediterranei U32]AEK39205.1 lysine exporter protein [Amycolatopsis mediterranei S699]AFO74232.1 lysine exporter protein [Amycolatopsis mediterranei S699]AGT81361.1 lysine exporter protein [Amycolatopsis mediterranei RB]KDO09575.1 lysine transporter LysE [Amycolatopsis mediterranei]
MWVFFGASVLVALTPGANNLLGLHHGMTHGVRRGLAGLGGRLAAFTLLIAAVAAGLGQLLAASETALTIIKWAGAAYLLYLGVRLLWSTFRGKSSATELPATPMTAWRVTRKEFGVALTNPKAILIFTAFVPQFIDPGRGSFSGQLALLGAGYLLAEFLAGSVYVFAGAAVKTIKLTRRARRNVDRGTGVVLVGLAGVLATSSA